MGTSLLDFLLSRNSNMGNFTVSDTYPLDISPPASRKSVAKERPCQSHLIFPHLQKLIVKLIVVRHGKIGSDDEKRNEKKYNIHRTATGSKHSVRGKGGRSEDFNIYPGCFFFSVDMFKGHRCLTCYG